MAGGLTVSVRQIASYPAAPNLSAADLVLVQQGGQGGPYASVSVGTLISAGLLNGPSMGIGLAVPANASGGQPGGQLFASNIVLPQDGARFWNAYTGAAGAPEYNYLLNGTAGAEGFNDALGFVWEIAPAGVGGQALVAWRVYMQLTQAGNLSLPLGTLSVARDPASALEVATMGWVGANTVASFNNRRGVVTLSAADIYGALGICPPDCIATTSSVDAAICAAIQDFIHTYPSVWSWMGRVGDVFLTVADMNYAAANNPAFMPPLTIPEPPLTATDGEVITASWVLGILSSNPPGYATEAWVTQYVAGNAVTQFNGRVGAVNLTLADITGAGGAPIASPQFSGVPSAPTAAPGSNTGQIATTAFVQAAISGATAGVASFNGRTGIVTLNSTDLTNAGGALLASPAFTGNPTAPTAAVGNNSTLLATTAFVTAAVTAAGGVTSFNGRTGAVTLTLGDVTGVGGAPINSPALTGTPTGPTAAAGTNNTELATTAFVNAAISSIGIGVTSFEGRTGAVTLQANDISAAGGLINPNVALTGVPTAPTASAGTSSTQIATTAFVGAAILAGSVTTFNGRAGAVTLSASDISGAGGALLASPAFTGVPSAPTAAPGTSTTQLATTGFVTAALSTQAANSVTSFNGRQGVVTLTTADITGAGGAPIASPTFTGVPAVPTATAGTATTQAASTAFVMAAIAASTAGVTSFNSRTGAVTLQTNDVSAVGGALLASPQFTGTPTAPTPTAGDNSTNIATTAFVQNALATAAVQSFNGRTGAVTLTTADITGAGGATAAQLANYVPLAGNVTMTGPLTINYSSANAVALQVGSQTNSGQQIVVSGGLAVAYNPQTNLMLGGNGGNLIPVATGGLRLRTMAGTAGAAPSTTWSYDFGSSGTANFYNGAALPPGWSVGVFSPAAYFGTPNVFTGNVAPLMVSNNNGLAAAFGGWITSGAVVAVAASQPITLIAFQNWNGSALAQIGTIQSSGSSVSYNTTSDDRLKTNQNPITDGGQLIDQLAPITFNWDADPTGAPLSYGFSAQATEPVFPAAVSQGEGNPGDENFRPWGMDLSKMVPLLVAAVQALRARVAALESHAGVAPAVAVAQ